MGIRKVGDWARARKVLGITPDQMKQVLRASLTAEANFLAAKIREQIRKGPPPPLSANTMLARRARGFGGSKALNVTGALLGSIGVILADGGMKAMIGAMRRSAKGANIARIMEEGATIVQRITPKMRRFLFGVLFKDSAGGSSGNASTGLITIRIPARPFIRPVFEQWTPTSSERMADNIDKLLGRA